MGWVLSYGCFVGHHCPTTAPGWSEVSRKKFPYFTLFSPLSFLLPLLQVLWRKQRRCNCCHLRGFDAVHFSLLHRTHFSGGIGGLLSRAPTGRPHFTHFFSLFLKHVDGKLCKGQNCSENDILWPLKLQFFSKLKKKRSENIWFAVIKVPRSIWTGDLQVLIPCILQIAIKSGGRTPLLVIGAGLDFNSSVLDPHCILKVRSQIFHKMPA